MYRVIYYKSINNFSREWAESRDEALLEAIDRGCSGITITWLDNDSAPSSWRYFLLKDDIRGVGASEFKEAV